MTPLVSKQAIVSEIKTNLEKLKHHFLRELKTRNPQLIPMAKNIFTLMWVLVEILEGHEVYPLSEEELAKLYEIEEVKK